MPQQLASLGGGASLAAAANVGGVAGGADDGDRHSTHTLGAVYHLFNPQVVAAGAAALRS